MKKVLAILVGCACLSLLGKGALADERTPKYSLHYLYRVGLPPRLEKREFRLDSAMASTKPEEARELWKLIRDSAFLSCQPKDFDLLDGGPTVYLSLTMDGDSKSYSWSPNRCPKSLSKLVNYCEKRAKVTKSPDAEHP